MYKISRIAPNKVKLHFSKQVEVADSDIDNGKAEAFVDPPKIYGQERLCAELEALQRERDRINSFDPKAELAKLQKKEDMLKEIEAALKVEEDEPDLIS